MELITIKTFENSVEAHLLKSQLESEGIKCFLVDEYFAATSACQGVIGGIKLKINSSDVAKASEILFEDNNTSFTDEFGKVLTCPHCGSNNVKSKFKSSSGLNGFLAWPVSILTIAFPIFTRAAFECKNCKHHFKR